MSSENIEALDTDEGRHLTTSETVFQWILVATDFSKPSEQALKTAMAISQLFGSQLFLVHAAMPFYYSTGTGIMPPDVLALNLDVAKEKLDKLIDSDPALKALQPRATVDYGDALDLIAEVARKENVDLIVVGSHGASGAERLALGSVAECVLRQATCPVLIVGPHCKAEQYPFRSIVFAADLTATGLRGAQYACGLAERFHGELTLLHVIEKESQTPSVKPEFIKQRFQQELRQLLPPDIEQYSKTNVRVEYGNAAEAISDVARQECASMVVIGLGRRGALADHSPWSTLSHLTRSLTCAVLGVRGHLAS
jgi:nucleotide-binding universal stress UspA family protein